MKNNLPGIKLVFYRTLSSQSGASVTMGSIAAFLRQNGYIVNLCFLLRSGIDNSLKIIEESEKYPIIIAKPNFKDITKLLPLLKIIKKNNLIKRIFLCGPFASLNAKSIIESEEWLDGIIIGNPEETAVDLLNSLSSDYSVWNFNCAGGIWRIPATGEICINTEHKSCKTLNELPFPSRDIEKLEKGAYVNIESSRGCQYSCSFCHVPLYQKTCFDMPRNTRDPIKVVDEIEEIHKKLGKTLFIFNDPVFWSNSKDDLRILKFCDEIKKRHLKIKMYIYLRCNPFPDETIIKLLTEAGLVRVFLGIENASDQSLERYNKSISMKTIRAAWNILKKYKINIHIGYIVFEPYSTIEDIKQNIVFLNELKKLFRIGVIIEPPRMIPGTKMYEKLIEDSLLSKNLPFTDLTYGFKFKNAEVANLFYAIKTIFLLSLKKIWYSLEYYCVSGNLLITLAEREPSQYTKNIEEVSKTFVVLTKQINENIFLFINKILLLAEQGKSSKEIIDDEQTKKFIKNFKEWTNLLAVKWAILAENIKKKCGDAPLKEVYTGKEEL